MKKNIDLLVNKLQNIPPINDWLSKEFIRENKYCDWNDSIKDLHKSNDNKDHSSKSFRRLVFDELCANFLHYLKTEKE